MGSDKNVNLGRASILEEAIVSGIESILIEILGIGEI